MKVVVVGAGIIGTMTAYYLTKRGHRVVVLEREEDLAVGASFANGGIVHASEVMPWSQPGMPLQLARWFGKEEAPVLLRARAIPHVLRWGTAFLRECQPKRFRANTLANLRLALLSQQSFREVRDDIGTAYDLNTEGCIKIYTEASALDAAAELSESMRDHGMRFEVLDRGACVRLEPALDGASSQLAGGIYFPGDELGDCYKFTHAVADYCRAQGAEFHLKTGVRGLDVSGGAVRGVILHGDRIEADGVVVAAGVHSPELLRPLGIRLPVYPVKGVSVTVEATAWERPPRMPVIDESRFYALAPIGDRLRVVGSAEVTRYDATPDPRRCRAIVDNAIEVFPEFAACYAAGTPQPWAGLRPVTPSGTPLLGATPIPNVFVNTGHGHLGWTLSCGSGRVLADCIEGREPEIDLAGLTLR